MDYTAKFMLMICYLTSDAFKLYDPKDKKIIVRKDVKFYDARGWHWEGLIQNQSIFVLFFTHINLNKL